MSRKISYNCAVLTTTADNWNSLAKVDPLWSILTFPEKKGRRWKVNSFFETGDKEISFLMTSLQNQGLKFRYGKALDFGCGVGRLTRGLSRRFKSVTGVDVSSSMIDLARRYNRNIKNCHFLLNTKDNLHIFQDDSLTLSIH